MESTRIRNYHVCLHPNVEILLHRTDLSRTVDRHGTERCHVLSHSSRFLAAVRVERQPILPKTAENGNGRPWKARKNGSSLSEYSNSASLAVETSFSTFYTFFPQIWPLYTRSMVCQNTFEGLSDNLQGSFQAVQARFGTYPIKICLLMATFGADRSNTTKDPSVVQFLQL